MKRGPLPLALALPLFLGACNPDAAKETPRPTARSVLQEIQASHVQANVPGGDVFDVVLRRDLESFFSTRRGAPVRVEAELLRDLPTQTGVAAPKFYAWVKVSQKGQPREEGAVRVAASEQQAFEVTDFLSEKTIRADAAGLNKVFPEPVAKRIRKRLGL